MRLDVNELVKATVDQAIYNYPKEEGWEEARDRLIEKNAKQGNTDYTVDNDNKCIIFNIGDK